MASEIRIKGMVCERCVAVIKDGVRQLGYPTEKISLGRLSFINDPDREGLDKIGTFLRENGFEILSSRQVKVIHRVKELIHEVFARNTRDDFRPKFSSLLSEELHMNYDAISALFSRLEGITLEKYIIARRLEKVMELLVYTDYTLTQIAYVTGFSSVNHLSKQFRQLTGHSPSHYKAIKREKEKLSSGYKANL